jgi:hypothetical protein
VLVAKVDAPDARAVPWLLLKATSSAGTGPLARAKFIQRVDTVAGEPPATGCDAAHEHAETRSPYHATYYFFGDE